MAPFEPLQQSVQDSIWSCTPVEISHRPNHSQQPTFELEEHPIDVYRPLKVAVIGAGISGAAAGALLPAKVPGIDLTIIEKNSDIGGTWLENVYPGVRCSSQWSESFQDKIEHRRLDLLTLHTHLVYQSSFSPNTQWTEEFATGAEIRQYWQDLGKRHGVYKYTQFNRKVERAEWIESKTQWKLVITDLKTREVSEQHYDFVITAIGLFNSWRYPDYPGLATFKGHLCHSSNWDPSFEAEGKRVAVIGNGASGLQLVPELAKVVSHLDHYARSGTWIAGSIGGRDRQVGPMLFSKERLKEFEDPDIYLAYRKELESTYWRRFGDIIKDSKQNSEAREKFTELMTLGLAEKPELLNDILPEFSPHCRRLTPGPGYLEALTKENVSFFRTPIKRITETGIETEDGVHRVVDAIICSTGAKVDFAPKFPIISGDLDLSKAWTPGGHWGFPYTYLGMATPGFPNLAFIHGPNASGWSGTVPHNDENQITYIARLLRKTASHGIRTAQPSKAATDDFSAYTLAFFPRTVLSENCSSWANDRRPGGRIHGFWPGSAAHVTFARRSPRWEDWEWTLLSETGNRFAYFGNGWTTKEADEEADVTPYLKKPEDIDLRDHHESWWDL